MRSASAITESAAKEDRAFEIPVVTNDGAR